MHIMGDKDAAVNLTRSEDLASVCRGAKGLKHSGGHDVPKSEADRETILNFLRENLGKKKIQSL
jgi:hypothetical protein